ncbi:MAG: sigma-54-dependent Fis family transcriptional regulator [Candidatus Hydrogenedentes bacterium]|nr:sigma-54-dependent Fis family transcriptional regulator [Candidatus Hydrogenedentota bacterium]
MDIAASEDSSDNRVAPDVPLNILVVDDEANIRKTLKLCLEAQNHRVTAVSNPEDAEAEALRQVFDLAFVDMRLGTSNGLDLIPALKAASPWIHVVVITAYASIDTAVEAMRRGAADYIPKPFHPDHVLLVTRRVGTLRTMQRRLDVLQEDLKNLHPGAVFHSESPAMQRTLEQARQVALSEATVLLRGPSGTGKTVLARAIHEWSPRAAKPFVTVSCPSLSRELLESELFGHVKGAFTGALRDNPGRIAGCEGGTLFLDEIGDLPAAIQPKLLRFLQERTYERVGGQTTITADVRIIAATNTPLEDAVREGRFREDLYYRLNVFPIAIPALAARPDDVESLAAGMLPFFAAQNHKRISGFTQKAIAALRGYPWPGNIRELRNVVERAAILCAGELVDVCHLPDPVVPAALPVQLGDAVPLDLVEEQHIRRVLAVTGSLQNAADVLGIDQATLWRKRKQYGI